MERRRIEDVRLRKNEEGRKMVWKSQKKMKIEPSSDKRKIKMKREEMKR